MKPSHIHSFNLIRRFEGVINSNNHLSIIPVTRTDSAKEVTAAVLQNEIGNAGIGTSGKTINGKNGTSTNGHGIDGTANSGD